MQNKGLLPCLAAAKIEAIKRIWALVSLEGAGPLHLNRRVKVADDKGAILLIVTFEEALAPAWMGSC